jgi:multimeric flavodoxin WrbA
MKALAFNSSPHRDKGNTHMILGPFLDGMKQAGADIELVHILDLDIKPCLGDYDCWLKTPGKCVQSDDMSTVLPKFKGVDILVFGTPLYVDGMSGPMKNFFDRLIALGTPEIVIRDNRCRHRIRESRGDREVKVVLVSNCGFWEIENFDPLVAHIKAICENFSAQFAGALLRPHGPAMKPMMEMGFSMQPLFNACRDAGRQLVETGGIRDETLKEVSRVLIPREMYLTGANAYIKKALAK